MATIGDYIKSKFSKFRIELDNIELEILLTNSGLTADGVYTKEQYFQVESAIIGMIPELLLMPDKTTGDTSLKWDRNAIRAYYKLKCSELGLPDVLSVENSITDVSDLW